MKKRLLILGASRGIGAEITKHFSNKGYVCVGVSRTKPKGCEWIKEDLSTSKGIEKVVLALENSVLDGVIFSNGTWEKEGFSANFDFLQTTAEETENIFAVNVIAPIELTKGLVKNLTQSSNPRVIYLGALSSTEGYASAQVAYTASKYALRGATKALSCALKAKNIGFTSLNPGNVATQEVLEDIQQGHFTAQTPIPISDILSCIEWLFSLSNAVDISEINLAQRDKGEYTL